MTSPGVPDIYQCHELWEFILVDPDNRRPVDFSKNRQLLNEMDGMLAKPDVDRPLFISSLLENIEDVRIKLFVVMQTLHFRHHHAALFRNDDYLKINIHGTGADQLLAFARKDQNNFTVIVVPRLMERLLNNELNKSLDDVWANTWLEQPQKAPTHYQELFSQFRIMTVATEDTLQSLQS